MLATSSVAIAQSPSNTMGNIINNQGIITQGQIGNNTINVAPPRLIFDFGIAEELIRRLPTGKPIALQTVGGNRDQDVATQYQQYLESHGYHRMTRAMIGVMAPPPDFPITIRDEPERVYVIIAPSVAPNVR